VWSSRRFAEAADLHAPEFYSHPLGAGFEAGREAWRALTTRYPQMRVVAQDVLVDGDRAAVRSSVEGIGVPAALFEIFRFADGRFVEMWGASSGFPAAAGPEEVSRTRS
jgi:hypothetical protein